VIMKTPGFLKDALSHPMTLVIARVLFISLPISHNNPKAIIELTNNKD